ncbi:MAG TPA: hypothetical protein VK988_11355 [Acidimicrobiales bacterium]|nr:hypothetical protein [Acidimicrobiales bacterium]
MRASFRPVLTGALVALTLASCGKDEATGPVDGEPATSATSDAGANVVPVRAVEYGYEMPDQITGGVVTFALDNDGEQPHEFAFVRLEDGATVEDLAEAFEREEEPDFAEDLAGVPVLSAGLSTALSRELEPGPYAFFCALPSPEGASHLSLGMVQGFEVAGDSGGRRPEAEAVIAVSDGGFDVPQLQAGRRTIELRNDGTVDHELALVSFEPGKGPDDVDTWAESGFASEAPAIFPGGIQSIPPETSVVMEIELEAGRTYTVEDFPNELSAEFSVSEP